MSLPTPTIVILWKKVFFFPWKKAVQCFPTNASYAYCSSACFWLGHPNLLKLVRMRHVMDRHVFKWIKIQDTAGHKEPRSALHLQGTEGAATDQRAENPLTLQCLHLCCQLLRPEPTHNKATRLVPHAASIDKEHLLARHSVFLVQNSSYLDKFTCGSPRAWLHFLASTQHQHSELDPELCPVNPHWGHPDSVP